MFNNHIIEKYLDDLIKTGKNIKKDEIVDVYNVLMKTVDIGGKIYLCGNGGSASTASHFQIDINNAFSVARCKMPAICITDNVATLTAISNDYSYDEVFQRQLKYLLDKKDVLITISGSGNSENVIKAAEYAKKNGNIVIALVGFDGGKLKQFADLVLHVNIDNIQITEDLHLMFCHIISTMIRESCET